MTIDQDYIRVATLDNDPPNADKNSRAQYHYKESDNYRGIMHGYAKSRLEMMFSSTNPSLSRSIQFWFSSVPRLQILYLLMSNWYERKGTPIKHILRVVPKASDKYIRDTLKEADRRVGLLLKNWTGAQKLCVRQFSR